MSAINVIRKFFPKVTTVVDATRSTAIEVTAKDASSRAVKNHTACAMAVACKRKFHLDGVIISRSVAYLVKGKTARRFLVPSSVGRELVSFDRGGGFAPGMYALAPITKSMRLGHSRGGPVNTRDRSNHIKRFRHLTAKVRASLGGEQS